MARNAIAAKSAGIPFTLSTLSNARLEEVASEVGGRLWMQLYIMQERKMAREIMRRAEQAGYEALVLTSDVNVFGQRECDRRNYRQPGQLTLRNLLDVARAVGERLTLIVDSGFRRGTDIVKALALGADAVMIGTATLYGLAAGAEAGARHALDILCRETDRALGQLGCNTVAELGPHLLLR